MQHLVARRRRTPSGRPAAGWRACCAFTLRLYAVGLSMGPSEQGTLLQLHSAGGVLLAAGAQLAAPAGAGAAEEGKRTLKVENLNTFQKAAQKTYFQVSRPLALPGPWPPQG